MLVDCQIAPKLTGLLLAMIDFNRDEETFKARLGELGGFGISDFRFVNVWKIYIVKFALNIGFFSL